MIEVFSTNVLDETEAERIISILNLMMPSCRITYDLSDCDKILRIAGDNILIHKVIEILNENNYKCKILD